MLLFIYNGHFCSFAMNAGLCVLNQEIDGLLKAMRFFGLTNGTIITLNQDDRMAVEEFRIHVEPAFTFFGGDRNAR